MTITKHVIQRFKERITSESYETIQAFIQSDIKESTFLYSINHIEKRICNGIVYVIDNTQKMDPKVITLYIAD